MTNEADEANHFSTDGCRVNSDVIPPNASHET